MGAEYYMSGDINGVIYILTSLDILTPEIIP